MVLTIARLIGAVVNHANPLAVGFYTVPEATRLIRLRSSRRIYGWLRGYPNRSVGPLLDRDFTPIAGSEELSFLDLMEVRFVERFSREGVKVRSLRKAFRQLQKELKTKHPFAHQRVMLVADRADVFVKEVFRKSAEEFLDVRLRSLTTQNYVMYETIKQSLLPGLEFDPATQLTNLWHPIPDRFPDIVVNPKRAFGQPVTVSGVPTGALFDAWKAEGGNVDTVADWYNLSAREVAYAVDFEQALDNASQREPG